jgi:hypothetical protein
MKDRSEIFLAGCFENPGFEDDRLSLSADFVESFLS